MKLISFVLAFVLATSQALACIPLTFSDGFSLTVNRGGLVSEFIYADLASKSRTRQAAELMSALQALMDDVRPIELIESLDPDKNFDPDHPNIFWIDADGEKNSSKILATHVVSRCVLVTDVVWDSVDGKFVVSWLRVQ